MILAAGVALLVIVAVVIALAIRRLRGPARDVVAVEPHVVPIPEPLEAALPEAELTEPAPPEPEPEPVISWTAALTGTALDEAARSRLIDDLTLLAAPWTIELLRRAYEEESSPHLRARIEAALTSPGDPVG
jgi:hypothetical protein